jgi:O-antigen ligase
VIRILVEKNLFNFKIFFFICSLCALFVCIDIFYQLFNEKDFFGHEVDDRFRKLSGPFGDEYIAGGYIQRFSLFAFFLMPAFYSNQNIKIYYPLIIIMFLIFFIGIILSGNRMPLILFFLTLCLIFVFEIKDKKKIFSFIAVCSIIFFLIFNFNTKVRDNFNNFYFVGQKLVISTINKNFSYSRLPYYNEFSSGYNTWLYNKTFGGGIKNFNFYCYKSNEKFNSNFFCNNHPHNYYLEIFTETGFVGFLLILVCFIMILYLSLVKKYFFSTRLQNNEIITPFIFLFIAEIFPFKSSGSFFTTGNASYVFLIMAILVGLIRKEKLIENKDLKDIN